MAVDSIYWLDQIDLTHRPAIGDKAFYLGLLKQRGYPVVPGFVISAVRFQEFLGQIHWQEPVFADLPNSSLRVDVDNPRQLQTVSQQIRQAIQATPLPDDWLSGIRSAVETWASPAVILRPSFTLPTEVDRTVSLCTQGLLESHVCWAENETIAQGLKQVWAELFRARSLLYWQRLGIHLEQIQLAVLVQPIWTAVASGTVQCSNTHLEVEAVLGLGQAWVRGEALPERYQISLHTHEQTYYPGRQGQAYRISTVTETGASKKTQPCLQTYPITSNQKILTNAQFQKLVDLSQHAASEIGIVLQLEWTLHESPELPHPELYLTQVIPHFTASTVLTQLQALDCSTQSSGPQSLMDANRLARQQISGLGAAPGYAQAIAYVVQHPDLPLVDVPEGAILVAPLIMPQWLLKLDHLAGIVTEQGGLTSHGAILARERGLPAVVGVHEATHLIQTGNYVIINGDRGEVHWRSSPSGFTQGEPLTDPSVDPLSSLLIAPHASLSPIMPTVDPTTHDLAQPSEERLHGESGLLSAVKSGVKSGNATRLWVTLSQPDAIQQAAHLPVDGVGLWRSELLMLQILNQRPLADWLSQDRRELVDRLVQQMRLVVQALDGRPVFYRSHDLRRHEFPDLVRDSASPELNPTLGMHGTFSYQVDPALFEIELAALKQVQQNYGSIHLLLPFVRTVEEFRFCRQHVEQVGLSQHPQFQLWMMAEVPSVLLLLPEYAKAGVQGVAIGTNDLAQLLLGADRDHPQLAALNAGHPAVKRAIQQIIQMARQANLPCSICGQAVSHYPELIDDLVRWGITAISVDLSEVERIHPLIARAERRLLLEAARQLMTDRPLPDGAP